MSPAYNFYNQTAQQLQLAKAEVRESTPVYAVVQPSRALIFFGRVCIAGAAAAVWTLFGEGITDAFRKTTEENRSISY